MDIDGRSRYGVTQLRLAVRADMRLHPEIPLGTLLGRYSHTIRSIPTGGRPGPLGLGWTSSTRQPNDGFIPSRNRPNGWICDPARTGLLRRAVDAQGCLPSSTTLPSTHSAKRIHQTFLRIRFPHEHVYGLVSIVFSACFIILPELFLGSPWTTTRVLGR